MALNRRQMVQHFGLYSFGATLIGCSSTSRSFKTSGSFDDRLIPPSRDWVYGAGKQLSGDYALCAFQISTQRTQQARLPHRGHGLCVDQKRNRVICIDRRPGYQFQCYDPDTNSMIATIKAPQDHHFYGHGCLSHDHAYLYVSEQHWPTGTGLISVYDAQNFNRIGEFKSGGIGPHELLVCSNSNNLVVANGGIRTHPDLHRQKLNLDTMLPNLTYLNESGKIKSQHEFGHHQLSIRHLCQSSSGEVIAGLQFQGDRMDVQPLAIAHHLYQAEPPEALQASDIEWLQMVQYTASLCWIPGTSVVAITAPRANRITFWEMNSRTLLHSEHAVDAAGVAALDEGICAVSLGTGEIKVFEVNQENALKQLHSFELEGFAWDNHLAS